MLTKTEYKISRRQQKEIRKREFWEFVSKKNQERESIAASMSSEKFYRTTEWKKFRYQILKTRGNRCECCGRGPKEGAIIQVDHILSRWVHPERAFDVSNMQILCLECNEGKGVKDATRWSAVKSILKVKD